MIIASKPHAMSNFPSRILVPPAMTVSELEIGVVMVVVKV